MRDSSLLNLSNQGGGVKRKKRLDVKKKVETVFGIRLEGLDKLQFNERRKIWNWLSESADAGQKAIDQLEEDRGEARKNGRGVG